MSSLMQSTGAVTKGYKAKKIKSSDTSAKSKKSAVIVMPKKDGGWKQVRDYLDVTEKKLSQLGDRLDGVTSRIEATIESKAKAGRSDVEKYYKSLYQWLGQKISKARSLEATTETWYDTALVKSHLAKMEASDIAGQLAKRFDKLKFRVERMVH